jgi:DNA modification methylase
MELNKIHNEDCLVGMKKISSKAIDLIVSDPPYIIDNSGGGYLRP